MKQSNLLSEICDFLVFVAAMTTATVTYHELPPLTSWAQDEQNQAGPSPSQVQMGRTLGYPMGNSSFGIHGGYPDTEEDIKWSHFVKPGVFEQQFSQTNVQPPHKKVRSSKCRAPALAVPSEELCLVCGDKASGYHYNALTCEGCKVVIPEEQCRMKREAKMRQRTATRDSMNSCESSSSETTNERSPLVTSTETELPIETTELISRVATMERQFATLSDEAMASLSIHFMPASSSSFQHLAELTILEAQQVHEFVRQLPGFMRLSEEDRKTLQKKYAMAGMAQLAEAVFEFARSLSKLAPDINEFALLEAIAIFSERNARFLDRPGLLEPKVVEEIQEVYTAALQQYIDAKRPKNRTMFARLLMKLTDLRGLNTEQGDTQFSLSDYDISSFMDVKPEKTCIDQVMVRPEPNVYYSSYPLP
uniref:NR LBD domain-containing protein n=1 Tax=Heterorhabditis bacteriophora TaxID=37862 RepID=A0A1I7WC63_HETBA